MKFSYTKNPPHQKSTMGGKKGKGKGEPREENRRGKREGNADFCASFLFPSLLPRRCSSLVKNYTFVFIKNRKVKFKILQCSRQRWWQKCCMSRRTTKAYCLYGEEVQRRQAVFMPLDLSTVVLGIGINYTVYGFSQNNHWLLR